MSKKFKGITKKGSTWYIDKVVNKKRINRSLDTREESIAIQRAKALVEAANTQKWNVIQDSAGYEGNGFAKIGDIITSFKSYAQVNGLAEVSINSYIKRLGMLLRFGGAGSSIPMISSSALTEELIGRFKENYVSSRKTGNQDSILRSANTIIRDARSMFNPAAIAWYKQHGLKMPEISGFKSAPGFKVQTKQYSLPPADLRKRTELSGRGLFGEETALYLVFMLAYDLGMRASEIMNAKLSWINIGSHGRPEMQIINRTDFTPKWKRERSIPIPDKTYEEIKEFAAGREYILPGENPTDRRDLVWKQFSKWMRSIGWNQDTYPKAAHELRKLRGSEWYSSPEIGPAAAQEWLGHMSMDTTSKFYARLSIDIAPIQR